MTDPFSSLPLDQDGKLREIWCRYTDHDEAEASMQLGWMPLKPQRPTHHDRYSSFMYWIDCACGRKMVVPS